MAKNPLKMAVQIVGSQSALARAIRARQQDVWYWMNLAGKGVPAEYCRAIEAATGGQVTRYQLRPDVFGDAPDPPVESHHDLSLAD